MAVLHHKGHFSWCQLNEAGVPDIHSFKLAMELKGNLQPQLSICLPGDSTNAVPHLQKLRTRVAHIWANRRGLTPVPGKYA